MSAKNLHSAYAVERRKPNEQDSFENLSDDDGEKVCVCKIQQKLAVDDLCFVHTSENNYIAWFISTLCVDKASNRNLYCLKLFHEYR